MIEPKREHLVDKRLKNDDTLKDLRDTRCAYVKQLTYVVMCKKDNVSKELHMPKSV